MSHTPGPWEIAHSASTLDTQWIYSSNPLDAGDIVCLAPDAEISLRHWKANARLISAAPVLLETLQDIVSGARMMLESPVMKAVHSYAAEVKRVAEAAIAKAEGRS